MDKTTLYTPQFTAFSKSHANKIAALRAYGIKLYQDGDFRGALPYLLECLNESMKEKQSPEHSDYSITAAALYAVRDYQGALHMLTKELELTPDNEEVKLNIAHTMALLGQHDKAIALYEALHAADPDAIRPLDGLMQIYNATGQIEKAVHFGNLSLAKKDAIACDHTNTSWLLKQLRLKNLSYPTPNRIFDPDQSKRNVIAFSLWGDNPRYTETAILNAKLTSVVYPGWSSRFYCDDTVPDTVKNTLREQGATVITSKSKGAFYGLFWRFHVLTDPSVDFFLVRDCDSVLNCQERVAVDEWLLSKKCFHVMRDSAQHGELILAGMWGGMANVLPIKNLTALIDAFYEKSLKIRTVDQLFLRYCLWPFVKQNYLAHDTYYTFDGARKFPVLGRYPVSTARWHVGQDWDYVKHRGVV